MSNEIFGPFLPSDSRNPIHNIDPVYDKTGQELFGPFLPKLERENLEDDHSKSLSVVPILRGVDNRDVWDFTIKQEGPVPHLYKDTTDNVTVGIGLNVPNAARARELTFDLIDQNAKPVRRATGDEIASAYDKILRAPKGQLTPAYDPIKNPEFDRLYMPKASMYQYMDKGLRGAAQELRAQIPRFDSLNSNAQRGLLDLQYNMGGHKFNARKWPSLFDAINMQDWGWAADESRRKGVGEDRNDAVRDLFLKAQEQDDFPQD